MLRRQQKKLEWIKPASHFTLVMSALQLHLNTILKKNVSISSPQAKYSTFLFRL